MKGIFGDLFDFNNNGTIDIEELAAELIVLDKTVDGIVGGIDEDEDDEASDPENEYNYDYGYDRNSDYKYNDEEFDEYDFDIE